MAWELSRHCERSEAIHRAAKRKHGLLRRGAYHRARIRAARWLLAKTLEDASPLPTPYRRHRHLVAAAGAARDLVAIVELQVLAQADAHLGKLRPVAGHGHGGGGKAGIGLDEGGPDVVG